MVLDKHANAHTQCYKAYDLLKVKLDEVQKVNRIGKSKLQIRKKI